MRKVDEVKESMSCLNRARDDEMLFVLLGRDPAAPEAIRAWIAERIRLGKNKVDDAQVLEARRVITRMEFDSEVGLDGSRRVVGDE